MEKNLGHATAYGYAKSKGYSGTEEEFAELMADYASVGQSAAQSAEQAAASATSASDSAATAAQAAQTATSKASEAVTASDTATTKASEASTSADTASAAATSAGTSAQTATTAAATATTKASEAAASATTATTAKTDAESARDAAAQSASEAAASAESIDPDEFDRKIYAAFATDTATGSIASFPDGADSIPMKDVLVHIEPVQAGSGDPSPDNIRPITGWTEAKVTRTGRNLINIADFTLNRSNKRTLGMVLSNVQRPGSFTLSLRVENNTTTMNTVVALRDKQGADYNKTLALITIPAGETGFFQTTFTLTTVDIEYFYCYLSLSDNDDATITITDIQLELGSTATDYEPYSGQTYDITFPSEAGTVYGGTLDVTSGVLTVDRAYELLDDASKWKTSASTTVDFDYQTNARDRKIYNNSYDGLTCSYAPVNKSDTLNTVRWTSNSEFKFGFRGLGLSLEQIKADAQAGKISILYDLATPITYQLTTQEITSLLGVNNLWADTGDSEVEYRANTELWVQRKITEAVAAVLNS